MKTLYKTLGGLSALIFIAIFAGWLFWWVTFIDQEINQGTILGLTIGDAKSNIFEKLLFSHKEEMVSIVAFSSEKSFTKKFPEFFQAKEVYGYHLKSNNHTPHVYVPKKVLERKDLKVLQPFDGWTIHWGDFYRNSLTLHFEDGKLKEIRRVRTIFSI